MFFIGEAAIDDEVAEASFCCDLELCKGACCTLEGGRGAPLEDDEVLEIVKAYPIVKKYLDEKSVQTIETFGLYDGIAGDFATPCIEYRACVFVYHDNGIAKCSFELAFERGELDWRKPISCHLFPMRIRHFGQDFVRYEVIDECAGGRTTGIEHKVRLHDFLKGPLVRKYGERWYESFQSYCAARVNGNETDRE
jgi:hypothetical protein